MRVYIVAEKDIAAEQTAALPVPHLPQQSSQPHAVKMPPSGTNNPSRSPAPMADTDADFVWMIANLFHHM